MMIIRMTFSAVFLVIGSSVYGQTSDEEQIRKSRERSNEAIAKHDTTSLALYWLEDFHVLTSRSISTSGRLANQRAFQTEFEKKEKVLYVRTPGKIEVFQPWNMASEYGRWIGTWGSGASAVRVGGSYYAKWHKVKGEWKIKAEIFTPEECSGESYCKEFLKN
jgi:ketosteroid isomerase-like protein